MITCRALSRSCELPLPQQPFHRFARPINHTAVVTHATGESMQTARLVAVATLLIAPSLSALQSAAPIPIVLPSIQGSADELSAEVQLYIDRGDELSSQLRFAAAARQYGRAAADARRAGHRASGASW